MCNWVWKQLKKGRYIKVYKDNIYPPKIILRTFFLPFPRFLFFRLSVGFVSVSLFLFLCLFLLRFLFFFVSLAHFRSFFSLFLCRLCFSSLSLSLRFLYAVEILSKFSFSDFFSSFPFRSFFWSIVFYFPHFLSLIFFCVVFSTHSKFHPCSVFLILSSSFPFRSFSGHSSIFRTFFLSFFLFRSFRAQDLHFPLSFPHFLSHFSLPLLSVPFLSILSYFPHFRSFRFFSVASTIFHSLSLPSFIPFLFFHLFYFFYFLT